MIRGLALLVIVIAGLTLVGAPATAQVKEVVIGVLYPLSGNAAQVGLDSVNAVKLAADIVNTNVDLNVPLGKGEGLPGLGGAKIRLIIVDHQGKPDVGQAEAERLVTQEKVHALFGAYFSGVTQTVAQVAERYGVPHLNAESSSPALTERGLKWFFRTSPHDGHFSVVMFDFLKDLEKRKNVKFKTVGIMHEATQFGSDSAKVQEELAKKHGYEVAVKISYRDKATNLDAEVGRLKAANPDVFLPSSYTNDAILFVRTAKTLDYNPKLIVAQNAGWTDPTFVREVGKDAEGHITRAPFALDMAAKKPLITQVNELYKKANNGREMSDVPARAFTGFLTLADAINRAKSVSPEEIRKALAATNIPGDQLIMPWAGVRFDDKGQNTGVRAILQQVQNGAYATIYPFELAARDAVYPLPAWKDRK
ncbi:MAG: ABC transporter substrate-binding protein [Candidatus Rokubacteria bacterium]|nr:ABC transporter substrate-binding protein [Candidatus Rokubacteria bacterium]